MELNGIEQTTVKNAIKRYALKSFPLAEKNIEVPSYEKINTSSKSKHQNCIKCVTYKSEDDQISSYLGNTSSPKTKIYINDEKCKIMSAIEHLTLKRIMKIDEFLSAEEKQLLHLNNESLVPQLKKEYKELSYLVQQAQNFVGEVNKVLEYQKRTNNMDDNHTRVLTRNYSVTECKNLLIHCLRSISQIKSFLQNICKACKLEYPPVLAEINNQSAPMWIREKRAFPSPTNSSNSTFVSNCPCCELSFIDHEKNNKTKEHELSSLHKTNYCNSGTPLEDNQCILIYKDKTLQLPSSTATNRSSDINSNWAYNMYKNEYNYPPRKNSLPNKCQYRHRSDLSLGFRKWNSSLKNKGKTQSLHTPVGITCTNLYKRQSIDFYEKISKILQKDIIYLNELECPCTAFISQ